MMILHPPVCSVPGMYFRQLATQDILPWYAMLSLPEVFQHTSWNLQQPEDLQPLLAAYESQLPDSPMRLALVDASTQSLLGTIGFHSISRLNRSAEIAYELAPDY